MNSNRYNHDFRPHQSRMSQLTETVWRANGTGFGQDTCNAANPPPNISDQRAGQAVLSICIVLQIVAATKMELRKLSVKQTISLFFISATIVSLLFLIPVSITSANARSSETISQMLSKFDALSAKSQLADKEIAVRFLRIADTHFNLARMARDAVGPMIKSFNRNQRSTYATAFRSHLAAGFVKAVREFGASTSTVLGQRTAPNGAAVVISRVRVVKRERDVIWLMCRNRRSHVCDIEVQGIRASARQRAAFSRAVDLHGINTMISDLKAGEFADADP